MMRCSKLMLLIIVAAMATGLAIAQTPVGTISGKVTDGKIALPGVTVRVSSPTLQGNRVAVTSEGGEFIFSMMPPGSYKISFELPGFQTVETTARIAAGGTQRVDAVLPESSIAEEITVTGSIETISTASPAATTVGQDLVENLPVPRNLFNAVSLAPGVHTTGPGGAITISGAQSYESLFMINGVVVNENLRGQATDVYIEDAIQETTTTTSGVSAEFGRFAGGVVQMLTKSGGNEFHGSLRDNFDKDVWTAKTPLTTAQRSDELNQTYEATFGGKILTDKIWFFAAARDRKTTASDQTRGTNIAFPTGLTEKRYEGKLTVSPVASHRFVASYQKRDRNWTNYWFSAPVDLDQLYPRAIPETLLSGNYTGVITDKFFVEAQYSQRKLTFKNSGARYTDMIKGTPLIDSATGRQGNSPAFCGVCGDETRDNKDYILKGSYFLTSEKVGSHDFIFGADRFHDLHFVNNHQSGSDWDVRVPNFIYRGQNWYPKVMGGSTNSTLIVWWPIPEISKGSDFRTDSLFINDRWRLNNNLSFNIGVRYDKNNGKNSLGKVVAKDSAISPRLGVTYDVKGDSDLVFSAYYGKYVTAIAGTGNVADASPGGNPSTLVWYYGGPNINENCATDPTSCVSPAEALAQIWNWFDNQNCDGAGNCGRNNQSGLIQATFRGYNRIIKGSLRSPYANEIAASGVKRLGNNGLMRIDYTYRNFKDLYETKLDMTTGQVSVVALGTDWGLQDLGYTINSNFLTRKYHGVNLQVSYRLSKFNLGGNYTWSHAYGNLDGETGGAGPVTGTGKSLYPEYRDVKWSVPTGDLSIDQRHKVRVWGVWDAIATNHNHLSVSLLHSYYSGTPYGAVGAVRSYKYVTNPGYRTRPSSVTYFFSKRDAYRTEAIQSTDLSLNYSFKVKAVGADWEIFFQPEIQNVFNKHAVTGPNGTVYDASTQSSYFGDFNPWTDKPKECAQGTSFANCKTLGANWEKGPDFGKATATTGYQNPRTYRFSIGIRF